jgi:hypothetical protein
MSKSVCARLGDLKLLKEFPDEYFDWFYLDSSHEY